MNVFGKWIALTLLAALLPLANAQNVHGVLRVVKGDVQIKSGKTGQTAKARVGEKVFPKDTVMTAKDSRAKIVMVDNNEINVSPESQVEIQNYEFNPAAGEKDVLLNVIYGKVRSKVEQKYDGKTSKFQIKTPSAVAGVRGTDFMMGHRDGASQVVTFEGRVEFGTPGPGGTIVDPVVVNPGFSASANASGASPPAPVPKEELAKMDGETKAEGPGTGAGSNEREPAGDNKSDKDKNDKDGAKKEGDGPKGDGAKSGGTAGSGAKTEGGGDGEKTAGPGSNEGGRQPANAAGPGGGSRPMMDSGDLAGGPGAAAPPSLNLPGPSFGPAIPNLPLAPIECQFCRETIENGNTKLLINIQTQ